MLKNIAHLLVLGLLISEGVSAREVLVGNDAFSMNVYGFAQMRWTSENPATRPSSQTYDVALARLAFSGHAYDEKLTYFLQLQASTLGNSNGLSLNDGWMAYQFKPELTVKAGRMLLPYSRQFYTHPGNLLLQDLSGADYAFGLTRSTGVEVSGKTGRLSYNLASVNSVRALDGVKQQNESNRTATVLRLELDILNPYGYTETEPNASGAPQLSFGVAVADNPIVEDSGFQNLKAGDSTKNLTADFGFRWHLLSVQGAYYTRRVENGVGLKDGTDSGAYGQVGYFLKPRALEIVGRYSTVDFDAARNANTAGDSDEITAGANYYVQDHNFKIQLDHTWTTVRPFAGDRYEDQRLRIQTQFLF